MPLLFAYAKADFFHDAAHSIYRFLGSWWEGHSLVASCYPHSGRHDELPLGVKISQAVYLGIGPEVWSRVHDLALGVSGMVFLNDGVEEVYIARVFVGFRVTGVDTHIALWM